MLSIDLGSYAQYLSLQLPMGEILFILPVFILLFLAIVLYLILKRIPIVSNVMGVIVVTIAISAILAIPLIVLFAFLELYIVKRVLILIVTLFMAFTFAIFNSRAVIKFVKESKSYDSATKQWTIYK